MTDPLDQLTTLAAPGAEVRALVWVHRAASPGCKEQLLRRRHAVQRHASARLIERRLTDVALGYRSAMSLVHDMPIVAWPRQTRSLIPNRRLPLRGARPLLSRCLKWMYLLEDHLEVHARTLPVHCALQSARPQTSSVTEQQESPS